MLATKDRPSPILPGLLMKQDAIAGRYRAEKLLGAGSSGFVVVARHAYLQHRVTLKILTSMSNAQQRAQRRSLAAAHAAASLGGRHIARIVDTGFTEEGMPFIATEQLDGRTLFEEMKQRGRLPVEEAVRWTLQACAALAEAHANGIVHGDLKPQNLLLAPDAETSDDDHEERQLKVLDFGMSVGMGDDADDGAEGAFSTWSASPAYLAPEQLQDPHHLDPRVDIWALGVILHELIAGKLPFSADSVSGMLIAVVHRDPELLSGPDVPNDLARIIQTCLAKTATERPANILALAHALAPFAGPDGPELVARVVTATASKKLPTRAPDALQASEDFGISHGSGSLTRTSMRPILAARRRWRARMMKIAAAAILTAIAIAASPSRGAPESAEPPRVPGEEVSPLPFVPHSFDAAPHRPMEGAPRAQRPKTPQPAAKPRATLAVRENPYGPRTQRPATRRNHPR